MSNDSKEVTVTEPKSVARKVTLKDIVQGDAFKAQLAMVLPDTLTPDRMVRVALTAMLKTPKIIECEPASVTQCLLDAASMGLEPDGRNAYLIPFGHICTLIPSWIGLVALARRSGEVSNIFPCEVCENDVFHWRDGKVEHEIDWKNPRGDVYAVYAKAFYKDGSIDTETMSKDEIEKVRKSSKSGNSGPWVSHWGEMAKKTVIKRLLKRTASSPELKSAIDLDDSEYSSVTTRIEKPVHGALEAAFTQAPDTSPMESTPETPNAFA